MENTFDERAEEYFNNLTQPLADPKGLAVTAYVAGCRDQLRIQLESSLFEQQRQLDKQAIKTKCLELASNKTVENKPSDLRRILNISGQSPRRELNSQ